MDAELKELYQETILDHNSSPRNFREMENPDYEAEGFNPLCGDQYTVYLKVGDNEVITEVAFKGQGCAISKSSASIMTQILKGKKVSDAKQLFDRFHDIVSLDKDLPSDLDEMDKMAVFAGVREFPNRVKCASLSWHTMKSALEGEQETITTE
jgi:nitrogen fixation NifU-like protein